MVLVLVHKSRKKRIAYCCSVLLLCATSCGSDKSPIEAARCFVIGVDDNERHELAPLFDSFAEREQMEIDKEHPQTYYYRKPSEATLVTLQLFLGELGASAAMFSSGEGCPSCDAFEEFVHDEIAAHYMVVTCDDVKGFRSPVLWNVDLGKK